MNTNAYVYINTFLSVYILFTNCLLTKYVYIIKVYIIILTDDIGDSSTDIVPLLFKFLLLLLLLILFQNKITKQEPMLSTFLLLLLLFYQINGSKTIITHSRHEKSGNPCNPGWCKISGGGVKFLLEG